MKLASLANAEGGLVFDEKQKTTRPFCPLSNASKTLILFLSMSYLVETENTTTVRSVPDSTAIHTISKYKMLTKGLSVDGETQKTCVIFFQT